MNDLGQAAVSADKAPRTASATWARVALLMSRTKARNSSSLLSK